MPSPPQVTAVAPAPSQPARRRDGGARNATIRASPAVTVTLTVASRMGAQATGVASPSSRVGSEKSTQPTNQNAAAITRPSSASRAVAAAVEATPGSRSSPAEKISPVTAVPIETMPAQAGAPVRRSAPRARRWRAPRPPRAAG